MSSAPLHVSELPHAPLPDLIRTLGVLLAGGRGSRLHELTRAECKPALHFAGGHRIADFSVANALRSGLSGMLVATQYMPGTLSRHLTQVWGPSFRGHGLILRNGAEVVPGEGYAGTAAAVAANADLIDALGADEVVILSGDHVYGMDYRPLIAHHRATGAGITVAALPVPVSEARGFGVIAARGDRIAGFAEKPAHPEALPDDGGRALASLGIYVARWDWLRAMLRAGRLTDFGNDVLPQAVARGEAAVWRWDGADGAPYWRDVGTLDAFRACWLDMAATPRPVPRPVAPDAAPPVPPAPNTGTTRFAGRLGGGGVQLLAPRLRAADPSRWAVLDGTVLMPGSRVAPGVRLTDVIVAPGTPIPEGLVVGEDADEDARWFRRTAGGTTLVTTQMLARRAAERRPALSLRGMLRIS